MTVYEIVKLGEVASIRSGKKLPVGKDFTTAETAHSYIRARVFSPDLYRRKYAGLFEHVYKSYPGNAGVYDAEAAQNTVICKTRRL